MPAEDYWDIMHLVERIKEKPQTYKTLLGNDYKDTTCQRLVREKLNKLVKEGDISKVSIPGTRFGESLYYAFPKNHHILVESARLGVRVFIFKVYNRNGNFRINAVACEKLCEDKWVVEGDREFFDGKVVMLI